MDIGGLCVGTDGGGEVITAEELTSKISEIMDEQSTRLAVIRRLENEMEDLGHWRLFYEEALNRLTEADND
jgi:hypothetical protein